MKFKKELILILSFFIFTSCFKSTVPVVPFTGLESEDISKYAVNSTSCFEENINFTYLSRPALLIADYGDLRDSFSKSLGSQYAFGGVPVTNLYLASHPDYLAVQATAYGLEYNGYEPYLVSLNNYQGVSKEINPYGILKPSLINISLDAYDGFISRINSVSGLYRLEIFNTNNSTDRMYLASRKVSSESFKESGHIPTLTNQLEKALLDGASEEIKHRQIFFLKGRERSSFQQNFNYFILPNVVRSVGQSSAEVLAYFYGMDRPVLFKRRTIAGLVQNGVMLSSNNAIGVYQNLFPLEIKNSTSANIINSCITNFDIELINDDIPGANAGVRVETKIFSNKDGVWKPSGEKMSCYFWDKLEEENSEDLLAFLEKVGIGLGKSVESWLSKGRVEEFNCRIG